MANSETSKSAKARAGSGILRIIRGSRVVARVASAAEAVQKAAASSEKTLPAAQRWARQG